MSEYISKEGNDTLREYNEFLTVCIMKFKIARKKEFINEIDNLVLNKTKKIKDDKFIFEMSSIISAYSTVSDSVSLIDEELNTLSKYLEGKNV